MPWRPYPTVDPDSDQTAFNIRVGEEQITTDKLNDMLGPGGGTRLRVTSIHGFLIGPPEIPSSADYAVIFIGALSGNGSVRGFGAGTLSLNSAGTTQINFDPGLVATLFEREVLTLRSQIQSNHRARIEVHGYLEEVH